MARGAATAGLLASPGPGFLSLADLADGRARVAAAASADIAMPSAGRGFNLAAGCAALRSQAASQGRPRDTGSPAGRAHGAEARGGARPSHRAEIGAPASGLMSAGLPAAREAAGLLEGPRVAMQAEASARIVAWQGSPGAQRQPPQQASPALTGREVLRLPGQPHTWD